MNGVVHGLGGKKSQNVKNYTPPTVENPYLRLNTPLSPPEIFIT